MAKFKIHQRSAKGHSEQKANPEERVFKKSCRDYVLENRAEIVGSVITVLKAYLKTDKPDMTVFGGYEVWSDFIRGCCKWLGFADPVGSKKTIQDDDPEKIKLSGLLDFWESTFGDKPGTVADFVKSHKLDSETYAFLLDVFSKDQETVNGRMIGNFIKKHKGKVLNGKSMESAGIGHGRRVLWKIHLS